MRVIAACLALALAGCAGAPARTGGIVSTNPCGDAILAELVSPDRIAAISHYSRDPAASSMDVALAARLPVLAGTAEEVVARRPDLVLLGSHTPMSTRAALDRAGVAALYLDVPTSIADSRAQIRAVAHAVGAQARGEALVARIDAAVARAAGQPPVTALIWQADGLVPGEGTLADDLLRHAGFANASAGYGLASWDMLPLERIAAQPPRVLLAPDGAPLRDRLLAHWGGRVTRADFNMALLWCGGPTIPRALERLRAVRQRVSSALDTDGKKEIQQQFPLASSEVEKRA